MRIIYECFYLFFLVNGIRFAYFSKMLQPAHTQFYKDSTSDFAKARLSKKHLRFLFEYYLTYIHDDKKITLVLTTTKLL